MNYPQAIVIAAALVTGAIPLSEGTGAQTGSALAMYELEGEPTSGSGATIWRLNTVTGEMKLCFLGVAEAVSEGRGICLPVPTPP